MFLSLADPFKIIGDPKLGLDPMVKNRCIRVHGARVCE